MDNQQLSLSEYLSAIQEVISITFDDAVWIKAEIRSLATKNGHYYLELSEKDEGADRVIATCKATIWKATASKLIYKFKNESGIELSKDLSVLIKVRARFDPLYGFSINIEDIDSSFTLGDLVRRYQQIVAKLSEEDLIDKNKQLPTPFDIHRVLVIAPERAAGLGDFKKDADILHNAGVCKFVYHFAIFQGNTAPTSIISALSQGLRQWAQDFDVAPDLIVVIRGGGAVNDLAYLNDYNLAALLCKRTVPVWVGIGHERDKTILDEIAHRSFDTPSKVIAGIRNHIAERTHLAMDYLNKIKLLSQKQIQDYQNKNEQMMQLIQSSANSQVKTARLQAKQLQEKIQVYALQHLHEYQSINKQNIQLIETLAQKQINEAIKSTDQLREKVLTSAHQQTIKSSSLIENLLKETLIQNPKNVLAKGYAIARSQEKTISSIEQVVHDELEIQLQDGTISTKVIQVTRND